jgi:O-antigen/teichoic acid export membrane protein
MAAATAGGPAAPAATAAVTRTAARQGALGLIGAITAGAGGLALTVTVGRLLPAQDAGVYFTAVAIFTIAGSVLMLGVDTGLVRALSGLRAAGRTDLLRPTVRLAVRPVLVAACAAAATMALASPPLATRLFGPQTAEPMTLALRLLAPFLVLSTLSMVLLNGASRGLGSLRTFTTVQQVLLPASRPLLIAMAVIAARAWQPQRPGASIATVALIAWAAPLLLAAAIAVREVHRLLPPPGPPVPLDPAHSPRAFWRATAPRAVAATFEVLIVWSDVVLVTALLGAAQGAVYAAASRFVTSGTFALQAVRLSVAPLLAAAFARADLAEAQYVHRLSVRWAILSTWPVYLAMAVFAPGVLSILGPAFAPAAPTLTLLCLAMLGVVANGNTNTVLNMAHRSHWAAANTGFATVVMLATDLALVPRMGILGAAVGWSAAMLTDATLGYLEVRAGLGLRSFDGPALRAALAVLLGFGLPALLARVAIGLLPAGRLPWPATLLAGCVVAGISYLTVLAAQRVPLGLDDLVAAVRRPRPPVSPLPGRSA